jgi:hypothetical protein
MDITTLLFVLAAVFFGLGAARVNAPINWTDAAFCVLTIALFLV